MFTAIYDRNNTANALQVEEQQFLIGSGCFWHQFDGCLEAILILSRKHLAEPAGPNAGAKNPVLRKLNCCQGNTTVR
jgi:hypothetical protein